MIGKFAENVGLKKYTLYVQDYGAPVGYRLAVGHPDRIQALVVQNGNAYDEGIDNDFVETAQGLLEGKDSGARKAFARLLNPGCYHLAVHQGSAVQGGDQSRQLEHRPAAPRPAGKRRDPARSFLQLQE